MNEHLVKHIESKRITQEILKKVDAGAVEITTNSAELTSIMIKIIYSKIGGKMGLFLQKTRCLMCVGKNTNKKKCL